MWPTDENQVLFVTLDAREPNRPVVTCGEDASSLHRWLVSFASGPGWYPVGEFVALDAQAAIDRAVEVFGTASDYRAEEIPWDAAPLPRPVPGPKKY
jgi:hypothetical protein